MDTAEKVRENRLRRAATRRGLKLVKSRTRDHKALDYGRWWITDLETGLVIYGSDERLTIDDIEEWMDRD